VLCAHGGEVEEVSSTIKTGTRRDPRVAAELCLLDQPVSGAVAYATAQVARALSQICVQKGAKRRKSSGSARWAAVSAAEFE
jgi:hypothetical protein